MNFRVDSSASGGQTANALLALSNSFAVISLDVFDTLVTRACSSPDGVFRHVASEVSRRGLTDVSQDAFAATRRSAEDAVLSRNNRLDSHIDLRQIYEEFYRQIGRDNGTIDELIEIELQAEIGFLRPTALAAAIVTLSPWTKVVLVSDTYLRPYQLKRILEQVCGRLDGIEIFTSQQFAASKASGRIFPLLLSHLDVSAHEVLHVGDSKRGDVKRPRQAGLSTLFLANGSQNRFERRLESSGERTGLLGPSLAGASRVARLGPHQKADSGAISEVAAGVLAPLVIGYTLWCLERATYHGCRQLAFVARDGQILFQAARILAPQLELDIEPIYLRVSRRTTNLASMTDIDDEDVGWILRNAIGRPVEEILGRVRIDPHTFGRHDRFGLLDVGPLDEQGLDRLVVTLRDEQLLNQIRKRATRARELLSRQLYADGLVPGAGIAVADGGGTGSQVRSISKVLQAEGFGEPRSLLLGLDRHPNPNVRKAIQQAAWLTKTETWLFDDVRERGFPRIRGLTTVMQLALAATHGSIADYIPFDDVRPPRIEMDERASEALRAWGVEEIQATIARVIDETDVNEFREGRHNLLRPIVLALAEDLFRSPSPPQAKAWGTFPFESGEIEALTLRPLAAPYTLRQALGFALRRQLPPRGRHWHEAAREQSNPGVRAGIVIAEQIRGAVRRLWK